MGFLQITSKFDYRSLIVFVRASQTKRLTDLVPGELKKTYFRCGINFSGTFYCCSNSVSQTLSLLVKKKEKKYVTEYSTVNEAYIYKSYSHKILIKVAKTLKSFCRKNNHLLDISVNDKTCRG